MPMITISGPEKAGKTTLMAEIARQLRPQDDNPIDHPEVFMRHWGPVQSDTEFLDGLKADIEKVSRGEWVIWDRSWICDHAYSYLLDRDRRFGNDPWLAQWLYGRAVDAVGVQAILVSHRSAEAAARRDDTDLPVDPELERMAYIKYANRFDLTVLVNFYTAQSVAYNAARIIDIARQRAPQTLLPPAYAGLREATIVVVGDIRNERSRMEGSWLPFTSPYTMRLAKVVEGAAHLIGWTNAGEIAPGIIYRPGRYYVACGARAATWVRSYVAADEAHVCDIIHPASLYRWGSMRDRIVVEEGRLQAFVRDHLN